MPDADRPGHASRAIYHSARTKSALRHFVMGKVLTALSGLAIAIIVVRALEPVEYGAYAVLQGLNILLAGVSVPGLRQTAHRFIPELVRQGSPARMRHLMRQLLVLRCAFLLLAAAAFYLAAPSLAEAFGLERHVDAMRLACLPLIGNGAGTFSAVLLQSVMNQATVNGIWIATSLARLGLAASVIFWGGGLTLCRMLLVDGAAMGLGAAAMIAAVWKITRPDPGEAPIRLESGLKRRMVRFSAAMHLMNCTLLLQGGAINKVVAAAFLSPMALALFGFAQTMADYAQNYLPNFLLGNILRPALMSRFFDPAGRKRFRALNDLFMKANLFLLAAVALVTALCGPPLADWASGGRYPDAAWLFLGLLMTLAMQCHYMRIELVAQALERSRVLIAGNLIMALSIPLALALAPVAGAWGIIGSALAMAVARDAYLLRILGGEDSLGRLPAGSLARIAACALIPMAALFPFRPLEADLPALAAMCLAALAAMAAVAGIAKPFSSGELRQLKDLFRSGGGTEARP